MDIKGIISGIASRFKEPSSWAGIAAALAVAGIHLDPTLAQAVTYVGAGMAGVVAFFLPEQAK